MDPYPTPTPEPYDGSHFFHGHPRYVENKYWISKMAF
ncbi:hypothetical protein ZEAMMB73_Zm00001d025661 [Zea mays]|uniref:Uncharacterized protein n=1 Tax=Zea mays TaxID=4577 RepID=A0A1D6J8F3_MAIZE|nr:hypothetical protein ZEAMMB73_Zm00001d025661 [Zea mays]